MACDIQKLRTRIAGRSLLGRLWQWSHGPRTIPVVLEAPELVSNVGALCRLFPEISRASADSCRLELLRNHKFFEELNRNFIEKRHRRTSCDGWREFLYIAARFARPEIVIETGVFDGVSSAVILQALSDNGRGGLVSIDLPARETIEGSTHGMSETTLPPDTPPGWAVPDYLKDRYRLVLGDSREWLPKLLSEYPRIDIFFHDSLHTFEHQYFEYTTSWPCLSEGGLLLSDDIFWSSAFHKFCREKRKNYLNLDGFGAVKK